MRVSLNEVYRVTQRALEGAGAGYGTDRDGAQAVAWLAARGLPGLDLLAAALGRIDGAFGPLAAPDLRQQTASVDLGGRPALAWAGALTDCLALVAETDGARRLVLAGCRWPLALLPLAAQQVAPGERIEIRWRVGAARVTAAAGSDGACRIAVEGGPGTPQKLFLDDAPAEVTLESSRRTTRAPGRIEPVVALDSAFLDGALRRSLAQGVEVDDALWACVAGAARRVLVPASDESRARGAGGGDANQ